VAGFDFCIIDCEHGPYDFSMVAAMIAASRELEIDVLVRSPGVSREFALKVLDMGAVGLVIPMVSNAGTIREAVRLAKYEPIGRRGLSITRAHSNYRIPDLPAYMDSTNANVMLFAQIETAEGLEKVGEIAAVEGLDGLLLGPGDLSVDLGVAGNNRHPKIVEAVNTIAAAAKSAGVLSGAISGDFELLFHGIEQGMQVISWNSELGMILRCAQGALSDLRGKIKTGSRAKSHV
jgi:2-dehydro-3-deoxyglucarate aldolase/4-hydroxy-2-oxoheptanedioate aldolase